MIAFKNPLLSKFEITFQPRFQLPTISPFYVNCLCRYSMKILETQRFSDVFGGYRKRPVARNELGGYFCTYL